ncbi:MAG: glycosyl hydrolase, partial [Odoribacter sp.]|nr:glycosyl hydrolase [Odoribacter sp.]
MYRLIFLSVIIALYTGRALNAQVIPGEVNFITSEKQKGCFTISSPGKSSPILFSSGDYTGVIRALKDLQNDIGKVSSFFPRLSSDTIPEEGELIIAGTIGRSKLIDNLIKAKKIDVSDIKGKWESYLIQVVNKPLPGINKALVIAGSDKRATIYGIYDISEKIGVSPWYWWGDVPVNHKDHLFAKPGRYVQGSPSVKYRGIFLNDEAPALTNWIKAKYGMVEQSQNPPVPEGVADYGREFHKKLFELILRLKGNYLWPAMWNNAFNEDDPENPILADEYGIVMGNSHQEPMLRAQKEWDRRYQKTLGSWNYSRNPDVLESFWREGIKRNKD